MTRSPRTPIPEAPRTALLRCLRAGATLLFLVAYPASAVLGAEGESDFCGDGAAIVSGPPAAELFDASERQANAATWCERYEMTGRVVRDGPYRDRYPSGAARTRATFIEDELEGEVLMLHENGSVWMQAQYRDGQRHGAFALFSPSGAPWLAGQYVGGLADGPHTTYFEQGGRADVSHFVAGIEHGVSRSYYRSGQLRLEIDVEQGVWNGRFASWHANGRPAWEGAYAPCPAENHAESCLHIGATKHGLWQSWYEDGAMRSRQEFEHGEQIGAWLAWSTTGEPIAPDALGDATPRPSHPAAPLP